MALQVRSLKTRITLVTLTLFVLSIWSLVLFTGQLLRQDMEQLLGEQQFSTATIVAQEINQELVDRLHALEQIAHGIQPDHMGRPATLTELLNGNPLFLDQFNGGAFVTQATGTAIASVPPSARRVGVNFMERDHIESALRDGKTAVSEPVVGKVLKVPVVSLATPIFDGEARVIGALVGVINLSSDNFFDRIIRHRYGNTGGYMLLDPRHGRVVTSTDKSQVLTPLPMPGLYPLHDRYRQGFEGYGVEVNAKGVEYLSSTHSIPASGWMLEALLPTEEAFAPIRAMGLRMFFAAALLTVLAAGLTWWGLHRELYPLVTAAAQLTSLTHGKEFPKALRISRQDEIGQVIGGFNRLLETLRERETALHESEERFRTLVDWSPESIVVHAGGKLLFVNPAAVKLLGANRASELTGKKIIDFVHPDFRQLVETRAQASSIRGTVSPPLEERFLRLDGTPIDVQVQAIGIQYAGQDAIQVAIYDITERKNTERKLRQLSRITEQAQIAIVITDLQGTIEYVNPKFVEVTGFTAAEVVGHNPRILQSGKTPPQTYASLWATLGASGVWHGEFLNRKKSGEVFVEQAVIAPVLDSEGIATHYVAIKQDITLLKQGQQRQERLLLEKTALLNEVHHRVKNNLQVITSLLRLEEGQSTHKDTKMVLRDMQGRIRSMALVHETLYRSGNFAEVDLHSYLGQVASVAFRAQASALASVRLALDLAPARSTLDQATPCGLLVNELISNSLKHGFSKDQGGEVRVELQPTPAAPGSDASRPLWCLRVSDTGVGLPADFELRRGQSLGLQLVSDLVRQLGGTLHIESGPGAAFAATFPLEVPRRV